MKIIILILILASSIYAQDYTLKAKIEGAVFSKIDNTPIVNCNITIKGTSKGTVTDSLGKFSFQDLIANNFYDIIIGANNYLSEEKRILLPKEGIKRLVLYLGKQCSYDSLEAVEDIINGNIKLLFYGYHLAALSLNSKDDNEFENKYNLHYYEIACNTDNTCECIKRYNKIIFSYLDSKFGKGWRKSVRKPVIGL